MSSTGLTLMAVHAHPDDEATGTGGTFAKAAAEGIETVLVTCTDGRCGDGPGGVKPGDPGHDPDAVVAMRERELARSVELLHVSAAEHLGFRDSGMMGWDTNNAPNSFWSTPVDEAAKPLAELMRRYRPDVVVTYDENGFYGHPDHIQAHRITVAALDMLGPDERPAKVYWTTVPRSEFAKFVALMREFGDAGDESQDDDMSDLPFEIGLPDDEVTTWVDVTDYSDTKFEALATHASQSDNIMFLRMGKERFRDLMGRETYVRVRDNTDAPVPENDLFAGLR